MKYALKAFITFWVYKNCSKWNPVYSL